MQKIIIFFSIILFQGLAFASIGGTVLTRNLTYYDIVQIKVQEKNMQIFVCLGTIINDHTILTAAHCLYDVGANKLIDTDKIWVYYTFIPDEPEPNNEPLWINPKDNNSKFPIIVKKRVANPNFIKNFSGNYAQRALAISYDVGLIFVEPMHNYFLDDLNRVSLPANPDQLYNAITNTPKQLLFGMNTVLHESTSQTQVNYGSLIYSTFGSLEANKCNGIIVDEISALNKFSDSYPDIYQKISTDMLIKIEKLKAVYNFLIDQPTAFFCYATTFAQIPPVSPDIISGRGDSGGGMIISRISPQGGKIIAGLSDSLYDCSKYLENNTKNYIKIPKNSLPYAEVGFFSNLNNYIKYINDQDKKYKDGKGSLLERARSIFFAK